MKTNEKKRLNIEWQRLIIEEETCPRCGGTEQELKKAIKELEKQGFNIKLQKKKIGKKDFDKNPQKSNQITINGKTIEKWLSAKTGSSCCCDACGDADCRTVELNNQVYETIPADLIIQAGKIAARNN